jgi:transposase
MAASRTYLGASYMRLMPRLGKKKASTRSLLPSGTSSPMTLPSTISAATTTPNTTPERALRRITRQANALGLTVRFEPTEAA